MKTETIEFLKELQKNIKELEDSKEYLKTLEEAVEDAYDLDEDDSEREDEIDYAEIKHSRCSDNIEYLEKEIASSLTPEIAEDLVNSLNPETIQQTNQKFEKLFDNQKVSQ
jgi:predicted nuclease with TOPRIM domain